MIQVVYVLEVREEWDGDEWVPHEAFLSRSGANHALNFFTHKDQWRIREYYPHD